MDTCERIQVTEQDMARLSDLLEVYRGGRSAEACDALESELLRARVVGAGEIAADVVTMHSRVRFRDLDSGEMHEVTLVYPHEADIGDRRISVLAPIGTALLGLAVGQSIAWTLPAGRHRLQVLAVLEQPDAAHPAAG